MKALDTNILVRFLVKDDERQAKAVYDLFKEVESEKGMLFVPITVILETIWVLELVYDVPRSEIVDALRDLLAMPLLQFESRPVVQGLVGSAPEAPTDLYDLLIAHSARHWGCENVLTFDKGAAKSDFFELLG